LIQQTVETPNIFLTGLLISLGAPYTENMKKGLGVGSLFILSLCHLEAQSTDAMRPVETYQVESQYGPQKAVLNSIFPKDGNFELTFGANYSPLSSLYDYLGVSAGVIYHFNQRHAIEPIWAQYNFGGISDFAITEIADKLPSAADRQRLGVDIPRMIVSSSYIFTPYYSKMHLTDMSVMHMDLYVSAGVAGVMTEQILLNQETGDTNWRVGGVLSMGLRMLFRSRYGVRVEIKDYIHPAKNVGADEIVNNIQITAGLSIFLDSFPDYKL
jgi:outer membrane beta-barrel protein